MKFKIREQELKEKEEVLEFFLEKRSDKEVALMVNDGFKYWIICRITESGLERSCSVSEKLGIALDRADDDYKIKLNE